MSGQDPFQCPWCDNLASEPTPHVICESRTCSCGAIALGAPPWDFDEVVDDVIGIFGISQEFLTPFDGDRVQGLKARGVQLVEGAMVPATKTSLKTQFFWLRKSSGHPF